MLTFMTMGNGDIEASKIMSSLALALKATAVGLVIFIVSQVFIIFWEDLLAQWKVNMKLKV